MAGRILNRRALREQADHAPAVAAAGVAPTKAASKKKANAATEAAPKPRKTRAKKPPPRMCARWGVFDAAMKQVAIFDYNQRAAADDRLADLVAKKKGSYFLQVVKEPMPEPPAAAADGDV